MCSNITLDSRLIARLLNFSLSKRFSNTYTCTIKSYTVKATANFEGDKRVDIATYVVNAPANLYARTARFYDVTFRIGEIGSTYFSGAVLSGGEYDRTDDNRGVSGIHGGGSTAVSGGEGD